MTTTDQVVVDIANAMIEALKTESLHDWTEMVASVFGADNEKGELASNIKAIEQKLQALGLDNAIGAIDVGTSFLKDRIGESGDHVQSAIRLLKETKRLHQVGRGRGRALVLLTDKPLELTVDQPSVPPVQEAQEEIFDLSDEEIAFYRHLDAARVEYADLQRRYKRLVKLLADERVGV